MSDTRSLYKVTVNGGSEGQYDLFVVAKSISVAMNSVTASLLDPDAEVENIVGLAPAAQVRVVEIPEEEQK